MIRGLLNADTETSNMSAHKVYDIAKSGLPYVRGRE
jgi:hypothetical protein